MFNESLTSIVIVAFNCGDVIEQCIQSCIGNSGAEIIVVDNASKDNSLQIAQSFNDKIKLIVNDANKGFTYACNQGIRVSKGQYILLLNPDAWLDTGSLPELEKILGQQSTVGAVAPVLRFPDGALQNYTRRFPSVMGLWVESFVPMHWWHKFKAYRQYTCQGMDFSKEQRVEQPAGAALLLRNKWLLDEHYFIYGSDVDLCKTIINSGYQIIQTPKAVVYHHQSKGGTENNTLRPYLDLDNYYGMQYYFKKHGEWFNLISYRVLFSSALLFRAIISSLSNAKDQSNRWLKFKGFLRSKNFLARYE